VAVIIGTARVLLVGVGVVGLLGLGALSWLHVSVNRLCGEDRPVGFMKPPPLPRLDSASPPRFRSSLVGDRLEIVDAQDRAMVFHGASISRPVGDPDDLFRRLAARGINAVLLPISWDEVEPSPGRISSEYIEYLRGLLREAGSHGIGVVLSNPLHGTCGEGGMTSVPDWAARCDDDNPWITPTGMVRRVRFQADFMGGLWSPDDMSLQDHMFASWAAVARTLRGHPALIGYRPYGISVCSDGIEAWLLGDRPDCGPARKAYHNRFLSTLRSHDPTSLIIVTPETIVDGLPPGSPLELTVIARPLPSMGTDPAEMIEEDFEHFGMSTILTPSCDDGPLLPVKDLDTALASAFLPLDRTLSSSPRPMPRRVPGTPVSYGTSLDAHGRSEFVFTFRSGDIVSDAYVFVPGGKSAWSIDISDGHQRWSSGSPDILVWTTNPAIHTHTLRAKERLP